MAFLWLWLPTDTIQHGPTELLPAQVQAFQPEAAGEFAVHTAKKILERRGIQTSSSFVKI